MELCAKSKPRSYINNVCTCDYDACVCVVRNIVHASTLEDNKAQTATTDNCQQLCYTVTHFYVRAFRFSNRIVASVAFRCLSWSHANFFSSEILFVCIVRSFNAKKILIRKLIKSLRFYRKSISFVIEFVFLLQVKMFFWCINNIIC